MDSLPVGLPGKPIGPHKIGLLLKECIYVLVMSGLSSGAQASFPMWGSGSRVFRLSNCGTHATLLRSMWDLSSPARD